MKSGHIQGFIAAIAAPISEDRRISFFSALTELLELQDTGRRASLQEAGLL